MNVGWEGIPRYSTRDTLAIALNSHDWKGVVGKANGFSYGEDISVTGGLNRRVVTRVVIVRPDDHRGGSDRGMSSIHVVYASCGGFYCGPSRKE